VLDELSPFVYGTTRLGAAFRASAGAVEPLPNEVHEQLVALQYRWSDETDVHAEPWSM
jgi:hypothetical protein